MNKVIVVGGGAAGLLAAAAAAELCPRTGAVHLAILLFPLNNLKDNCCAINIR